MTDTTPFKLGNTQATECQEDKASDSFLLDFLQEQEEKLLSLNRGSDTDHIKKTLNIIDEAKKLISSKNYSKALLHFHSIGARSTLHTQNSAEHEKNKIQKEIQTIKKELADFKRKKPFDDKNQGKIIAKLRIQWLASILWETNEKAGFEIKTGEMINLVKEGIEGYLQSLLRDSTDEDEQELLQLILKEKLHILSEKTYRNYLTEIAPDYAKKGGRPKKITSLPR